MRYREFGSTGLSVSEIGFGCARLGGILGRNQSREESPVTLLQKSFDAGITFFDTADMYTQGESETLLGQAFQSRRDSVVIASKGGYCLPAQRKLLAGIKPLIRPIARALGLKRGSLPSSVAGSLSQDFSPDYLIRAVEASLRRLKTDHLDIYQVHSPPPEIIASGEFIEPLEKLKAGGKIRFYGVAVDTVEDARACLKFREIACVMIPFGLLDLEALDGLFSDLETSNVAVIARGCFGGGLLKPDLTEPQLRELTPKWPAIMAYRRLAEEHGRSLLEIALQFSLRFKSVSVTLLGMRTDAHLQSNVRHLAAPSLPDSAVRAFALGKDVDHALSPTVNSG